MVCSQSIIKKPARDINQNYIIRTLDVALIGYGIFAYDPKECFMPNTAVLKNGFSAWWQRESRRELTKLECGLLGALSATIVLMLIVVLGLQLSILTQGMKMPL
jgi:hypothetical protein